MERLAGIVGGFAQDEPLCRFSAAAKRLYEGTKLVRLARTEYDFTITLKARAEYPVDCRRAIRKTRRADIKPFVAKVKACGDRSWPDRTLTIEFATKRRENVERMHAAVRAFLLRLAEIPDGHVMRETVRYADEYDGARDCDGGLKSYLIESRLREKTEANRVQRG